MTFFFSAQCKLIQCMCLAAGFSDLSKFVLVAVGAYSGHPRELTLV